MARPVYTSAGPCYVKKRIRRSKSERNSNSKGKGKYLMNRNFIYVQRYVRYAVIAVTSSMHRFLGSESKCVDVE